MTVPAGKRQPSNLEFLNTYYKLRKAVTAVLLRDFGVKRSARDLWTFCYSAKFNHEDGEAFRSLCDKYRIDLEAEFPLWLLEHYRGRVLKSLYDLLENIVYANSIYPTTEKEWEYRRQFQQKAIANCYQLLQVFQMAVSDLPVDANKYMLLVGLIERELGLLKAWKKAGNKLLAAIRGRQ